MDDDLKFPFKGKITIAVGIYGDAILYSCPDELKQKLFDFEYEDSDFPNLFDSELPTGIGVYDLTCRFYLKKELGEFGSIIGYYPMMSILNITRR